MLNKFCKKPLYEVTRTLTNRGLVDCRTFEFVDLFIE